ncbi:YtzH-like family protein [Salipaludibacillus sp. CF4.18]|uniref:YtzH-like family protein n=1 Tax=Salipaludibacillus sp. CF4.18 TaxID=3373081 RepID=UPI003EE7EB43
MDVKQRIDLLQSLLDHQKKTETASIEEFTKMDGVLATLREESINENFLGTIQEIHTYVENGRESSNRNELVRHHHLNLSRWVEELHLLNEGGGKVTIDYEQRKGREI